MVGKVLVEKRRIEKRKGDDEPVELNKTKLAYSCQRDSDLIARLVDNLLIPLATRKDWLDRHFLKRMHEEYPDIVAKLPEEWLYGLTEQYVAFRVLGPDRLLRAYLKEPEVQKKSAKEKHFLETRLFTPWRYVFMRIEEDLGDDFFRMKNVLTDDVFLLYSPGVGKYEEEGRMSLYFSLLTFNGECHQTYGPIASFVGLQPIDLRFYARQLNDQIDTFVAVEAELQRDPLPFMMLIAAANFPLTYSKEELLVISLTELEVEFLDLTQWKTFFKIEEKEGVYLLNLKRWWKQPHYAHCHYAPNDKKLVATSTTDRGWEKLVDVVRELGVDLSYEPQVYTTMVGAITTEMILGTQGAKSPYESLFAPKNTGEEGDELEALNHFLSLLIPYLNAREEYDLHELAEEAGISYAEAMLIAKQMEEKFSKGF